MRRMKVGIFKCDAHECRGPKMTVCVSKFSRFFYFRRLCDLAEVATVAHRYDAAYGVWVYMTSAQHVIYRRSIWDMRRPHPVLTSE